MKLKGDYVAGTTYNVGDAVKYTDGLMYHLQHPAKSGTPPTNTRYWGRVDQPLDEAAMLAMDIAAAEAAAVKPSVANNLTTTASGKVLDARQGKALKDLIDALELRVAALEPATEPTPDPDTEET